MTTVVGDAARRVLVADTMYNDGETKWYADKVHKIERPDGTFGLLGAAGSYSDIVRVVAYLRGESTADVAFVDDNSFLLLTCEGLFSADNNLAWEPVMTAMAIGSGAHAAETMLRQGFTAEEAVRAAIDVDFKSGGTAKTYRLRKRKSR